MNDGKRFTTDIHTGPRRREHLGNLNDLAASITGAGLFNPIIITPGNQLISGYRRLQAATLLGVPDIPVHVAHDLAAAVDLITVENENRACQTPMAAVELVDYIGVLRAMRRTPRLQTVREAGNAILGFSWSRYCLIQKVVEAARTEDDPTGDAHTGLANLDAILAGQHPLDRHGRATSLKTIAASLDGTETRQHEPATVSPIGRRQPVRDQAKALSSAFAGLNGLIAGLSQVDTIDPAVTPADADRWIGDINRTQRVLRTLNNKLKEHADATR